MDALLFLEGVAGVDEAGRGPLAGPVVAAAVVLPSMEGLKGLNDSKVLKSKTREQLFDVIMERAQVSIAIAEPWRIDDMNILQATLWAMSRAVEGLQPRPATALIDGNKVPADCPVPSSAIPRADGIYASVAAASVIAKVTRDRIMTELAQEFPHYGFDAHFGYPTPAHLAALHRHGPCPIHRRTFGPVKQQLSQLCLAFAD